MIHITRSLSSERSPAGAGSSSSLAAPILADLGRTPTLVSRNRGCRTPMGLTVAPETQEAAAGVASRRPRFGLPGAAIAQREMTTTGGPGKPVSYV